MWIDFQAKADISRDFFGDIESVLKPIGFRMNWAKGMDNTDPHYVVEEFPRDAKLFAKLMKEFDPNGTLRNTQGESWFKVMYDLLSNNVQKIELARLSSPVDKVEILPMQDSLFSSPLRNECRKKTDFFHKSYRMMT